MMLAFSLTHIQNKATDSKKGAGQSTKVVWNHNRDHEKDVNPIIIGLQQTIDNQSVQTLIGSDVRFDFRNIHTQPKLKMSRPDDMYEQEADRIAEQVMSVSSSRSELGTQLSTAPIDERVGHKFSSCEIGRHEEIYRDVQISIKSTSSNDLAASEELAEEINYIRMDSGTPLDTTVRQFMESRFGYNFSAIRVHTDERSARSAKSVNALAYTIGNDIVFDEGMYMPSTGDGRRLLAHELAHTLQQDRKEGSPLNFDGTITGDRLEQEAELASNATMLGEFTPIPQNTGSKIARQIRTPTAPPSTAVASTAITRAEFDKIMTERYKVKSIHTGKFEDQQFGDMQHALWKSWDPGSSSPIYTWIVEAFTNFEAQMGGVPPLKKIIFFHTHYQKDKEGHAIPDKLGEETIASYQLGELIIYSSITKGNAMLQIQGGLMAPSEQQSVQRNIAHELGHGVAEVALGQPGGPPGVDTDLFKEYRLAVGWTRDSPDSPFKLYDIKQDEVRNAFKKGTSPPEEFRIHRYNFDKKPWKERPLTGYMTDNPGDDFAEAISAYVNEPQTLKLFSPIRYEFLDKRKVRWLPQLRKKHVNIWERAAMGAIEENEVTPERKTIWERALER